LFQACFPSLAARSNTGFLTSSTGKTKFAFFPELDERAVKRIETFLAFYERAVCIGANRHLEDSFSDELDFCLALDFIRPSPKEARTGMGELEYQAKYHRDAEALDGLSNELVAALRVLPAAQVPKPRLLTWVPGDPDKKFHVPAQLARAIMEVLPDSYWGDPAPLVRAELKAPKKPAKDLTVGQKIALWEEMMQARAIRLSRPVRDCSVVVVGDLYQSGASLWSFAKYLKSKQAGTVVGLACVKSLRDTDNQ
jgi:predicted amidophosphoribosyltransferase